MSATTRALIALALMVGFYVLALAVAFGLLWVPYVEWTYLDRINGRLTLACIVGAGIVLWSIVPRRDRFEPPGPRLDQSKQPRLFAEVTDIARAMGQEMPHEVYLVPDVNAWVAQRGGLAGFGSRRVMALGLPLMSLLTVSQFRAVLAHEFGHYHGGDTRLGAWIYKTRSAIFRTLAHLEAQNSWVIFLFKWYNKLFLHITLAISRTQEYAADRLAAQFAGANALIEGLKQLHRGSVAWAAYLQSEWLPVISSGYLPPISQGFRMFLRVPEVSAPVNQSLEKELAEGKADPLDSHPALPERIAALRDLVATSAAVAQDDGSATDLLEGLQEAEALLAASAVDRALRPVPWEDVLQQVWIPGWRQQAESQREALRGIVAANLGDELQSGGLRQRLKNPAGVWPTTEERGQIARGVAGCALALALLRDEWIFHTLPGEMYCEKNGERLQPFQVANKLGRGELSPTEWREICTRLGIANLSLELGSADAAKA
jgi:heat shock protein HtpX